MAQEIVNPGFEQGWEGWTQGEPAGTGVALSNEALSGDNSAKLSADKTFVAQIVKVSANSTYRLEAMVLGLGNLGVKVGSDIFFEQLPKPSRDWELLQVTFKTGEATAVSVFGSYGGREGRFDDFRLIAVDGQGAETSKRVISSRSGGYGLSPDLTPAQNFDLLGWYLNTPADEDGDGISDRFSEVELARGAVDERYFYTADDGGMVFRATIGGAKTSKNTRFTRTELRQMLRRGDTSIGTRNSDKTPNKNNWVFSSAPSGAQKAAGAVDGSLRATLAVNHVTSTGKPKQVGEVVIGQIHAADDEPARLYYRLLPGHQKGSLYLAHEISGADDIYTDLLGQRSDRKSEPENGIGLNEKFSYEITAEGHRLYVAITRDDEVLAETTVDMSNSGYDVKNDFMYFKAGVYGQNDSGDADDFTQATFYELEVTH